MKSLNVIFAGLFLSLTATANVLDYVGNYKTSNCSQTKGSSPYSKDNTTSALPYWSGTVFTISPSANGGVQLTDDHHQGWFNVTFENVNKGPMTVTKSNAGLSGKGTVENKETAQGLYQNTFMIINNPFYSGKFSSDAFVVLERTQASASSLRIQLGENMTFPPSDDPNQPSGQFESHSCILTKLN